MINLLALLLWAGRRVGVAPPPNPETSAFAGSVTSGSVFTAEVRSAPVFTGTVTTYPA